MATIQEKIHTQMKEANTLPPEDTKIEAEYNIVNVTSIQPNPEALIDEEGDLVPEQIKSTILELLQKDDFETAAFYPQKTVSELCVITPQLLNFHSRQGHCVSVVLILNNKINAAIKVIPIDPLLPPIFKAAFMGDLTTLQEEYEHYQDQTEITLDNVLTLMDFAVLNPNPDQDTRKDLLQVTSFLLQHGMLETGYMPMTHPLVVRSKIKDRGEEAIHNFSSYIENALLKYVSQGDLRTVINIFKIMAYYKADLNLDSFFQTMQRVIFETFQDGAANCFGLIMQSIQYLPISNLDKELLFICSDLYQYALGWEHIAEIKNLNDCVSRFVRIIKSIQRTTDGDLFITPKDLALHYSNFHRKITSPSNEIIAALDEIFLSDELLEKAFFTFLNSYRSSESPMSDQAVILYCIQNSVEFFEVSLLKECKELERETSGLPAKVEEFIGARTAEIEQLQKKLLEKKEHIERDVADLEEQANSFNGTPSEGAGKIKKRDLRTILLESCKAKRIELNQQGDTIDLVLKNIKNILKDFYEKYGESHLKILILCDNHNVVEAKLLLEPLKAYSKIYEVNYKTLLEVEQTLGNIELWVNMQLEKRRKARDAHERAKVHRKAKERQAEKKEHLERKKAVAELIKATALETEEKKKREAQREVFMLLQKNRPTVTLSSNSPQTVAKTAIKNIPQARIMTWKDANESFPASRNMGSNMRPSKLFIPLRVLHESVSHHFRSSPAPLTLDSSGGNIASRMQLVTLAGHIESLLMAVSTSIDDSKLTVECLKLQCNAMQGALAWLAEIIRTMRGTILPEEEAKALRHYFFKGKAFCSEGVEECSEIQKINQRLFVIVNKLFQHVKKENQKKSIKPQGPGTFVSIGGGESTGFEGIMRDALEFSRKEDRSVPPKESLLTIISDGKKALLNCERLSLPSIVKQFAKVFLYGHLGANCALVREHYRDYFHKKAARKKQFLDFITIGNNIRHPSDEAFIFNPSAATPVHENFVAGAGASFA